MPVVVLTLTLILLPIALVMVGPDWPGGQGAYRAAVLWGLPIVAGMLAFFTTGGAGSARWRLSPVRSVRFGSWLPVALVADYAFVLIGMKVGWATFTYGDQTLSGHPVRTALWALPACLALGLFGWEFALRGKVLTGWSRRLSGPTAFLIASLTGATLGAASIVSGPVIPDRSYAIVALISVICREVSFGLIFIYGGGLLFAGLYRGLLLYIDAFLIADWFGVYFPAANYVSSEPRFYWVRALSAIVSATIIGVVALTASRVGRNAPGRSGAVTGGPGAVASGCDS